MVLDLEDKNHSQSPDILMDLLPWEAAHSMLIAPQRPKCSDEFCSSCRQAEEDLNQFLRTCPWAASFWDNLGIPQSKKASFGLPIREPLRVHCEACHDEIHPGNVPWAIIFPFAVWVIWKQRNTEVFQEGDPKGHPHQYRLIRAREFLASLERGDAPAKVLRRSPPRGQTQYGRGAFLGQSRIGRCSSRG